MTTNVPSISLQTAVLITVKEYAAVGKLFSIYELTRTIRNKCNNGEMEIPDAEMTGGAQFRFEIQHNKIRVIFLELLKTGVFDPDFALVEGYNKQGGYRIYTPVINSPTPPVPQPSAGAVVVPCNSISITASVNIDPDVENRIEKYLDNCRNRNFRPSLRHVQSAIKRGDHGTGLTVEKLRDFIAGRGFSFSTDPNALSKYQVVV